MMGGKYNGDSVDELVSKKFFTIIAGRRHPSHFDPLTKDS